MMRIRQLNNIGHKKTDAYVLFYPNFYIFILEERDGAVLLGTLQRCIF